MADKSNSSRLSHNIISNYVGAGWNALMSFIFVPLYIKFLGIESYGIIGFFASIQAVLYILDMGLSITFSREIAALSGKQDTAGAMRDLTRTFATVYWGIALIAGLIFIGLAPLFAHYWLKAETLDKNTIKWATMLMGLVIIVRWPGNIYSGGLTGLQRFIDANIIGMIIATLRGVGVLAVLKWISPTLICFFGWQAVITLLGTIMYQIVLGYRLPRALSSSRFNLSLLTSRWRFAAGLTGITALGLALTQLDKILLSKLVTLKELGYYSLATTLAGVVLMVVNPITNSYFPRFTALVASRDRKALVRSFHAASQLVALFVVPGSITIAFYSRYILYIWTRNQDIANKAHIVLSIIIIACMLNAFINVPYYMQLAHSVAKVLFWFNFWSVVFLAPAIFFLASHYGIIGGATALLFLNFSYVAIESWFLFAKILPEEITKWYLQDILLPIGISLLVVVASFQFKYSGNSPFGMIIVVGITASTAYLFTALSTPVVRTLFLDSIRKFLQSRTQRSFSTNH